MQADVPEERHNGVAFIMPMEDYPDFPCPVCGGPMTDVDGMWECQNGVKEGDEWHCVSMWNETKPHLQDNLDVNIKMYLKYKGGKPTA